MIPDFIRHYYLPDQKPFLNLSDLSEEEKIPIVKQLNLRKEEGKMHRGYPDWYFVQRKEAEENLRNAYIKKGGKPQRKSPHYFTLGQSIGFEWVYKNDFRTIDIPISRIQSDIYFSIGDTLWTFAASQNPEVQFEKEWYQGELYNYKETGEIIRQLNLDLTSKESTNRHKVFCIESFIWSDEELNELVN
jgi:hypothetical protein